MPICQVSHDTSNGNPFNRNFKFSQTNKFISSYNPIALRKAKIAYNFGLSECSMVNSLFGLMASHNAAIPSMINVQLDFISSSAIK